MLIFRFYDANVLPSFQGFFSLILNLLRHLKALSAAPLGRQPVGDTADKACPALQKNVCIASIHGFFLE
jgi:hypothetical protein